ncbi:hypothetical protein Osc7112_6922 (plasmid) [Oscillatoria nigro-viridis PCC 7112]|uniref:DUF6788 domain-containing protein n=1 Tax=Phormidium nigroviride PCC 7112 TaxID=179408 RepID=K9VTW1_9CYAN|nr:hypothetical protein [Oscillatoria nigro-viridis]AFZ10999.1 hypothetical protein Osc7112_6922 [Oscillatoria nigro-viridis PCC 7112]
MAIPSVVQGTVEFAGKVFEVDSPRGLTWLESVTSFRFEPSGQNKPYTVRKESGKGGDYWYGYRKMAGKLHKKYIGKSSEISTTKLEEIAEALNTPPQSRVTDKVTEVTEGNERVVTEEVADKVTIKEFTALKSQVQALQQSLEALHEALLGKSDAGNCEELPKVTDNELQIELGNLQVTNLRLEMENQSLKEELEGARESISSQAFIIKDGREREWKLEEEVEKLRSQLTTERADREEIKNSAPIAIGVEFTEPATILSKLRTKRKKSSVTLADVEKILEILEES